MPYAAYQNGKKLGKLTRQPVNLFTNYADT